VVDSLPYCAVLKIPLASQWFVDRPYVLPSMLAQSQHDQYLTGNEALHKHLMTQLLKRSLLHPRQLWKARLIPLPIDKTLHFALPPFLVPERHLHGNTIAWAAIPHAIWMKRLEQSEPSDPVAK